MKINIRHLKSKTNAKKSSQVIANSEEINSNELNSILEPSSQIYKETVIPILLFNIATYNTDSNSNDFFFIHVLRL